MAGVSRRNVHNNEDDWRIDKWFKTHFPGLTYSRFSKILRKGDVRVDGKRVKPNFRLKAGMEIRLPPLGKIEMADAVFVNREIIIRPEDVEFMRQMVIYQDDSVIVLNKLPGLAVQGGTKTTRHVDGLLNCLRGDKDEKPRLVHRLDKDTSGILVIARTSQAARSLTASFRNRSTKKIYWALLMGKPNQTDGTVRAPLDKEPHTRGERMAVSDKGKHAETDFMQIDSASDTVSWMAFKPITGRTHQIRVHATLLGTPIVGDGKYGAKEAFLDGTVSKKLHLHARTLEIEHPDGGLLSVKADLPRHMKETWDMFGFDADDNSDPFDPDLF
jgi:23S rRNA pseudouridine955/2504/2580 synthase